MSDDARTKLAAARQRAEERAAARKVEEERLELEVLELEERLERELGAKGVMYEVLATSEGPVAVKLGESVLHTRFTATQPKTTDADVYNFVAPCVAHPSVEKFTEIIGRRPGVAWDAALLLQRLFHAKSEVLAGKV